MKSDTVYILGAGFNKNADRNEFRGGLEAPLSDDFFQLLLKSRKFSKQGDLEQYQMVFDYIQEYWKMGMRDLKKKTFNLEECFTLLDLQMRNYKKSKNYHDNEFNRLARVDFYLTGLLAEFLADIDLLAYSDSILKFGERVYREKSNVITFNYDCILENAISTVSGIRKEVPKSYLKSHRRYYVTHEELPYSHSNWNLPLAYGMKFDEVQLQRAGLSKNVTSKRFYGHPENELYDWNIIKLHGSLNWFRYLPIRQYPVLSKGRTGIGGVTLNKTLLVNSKWWGGKPPDRKGWIIIPRIITPIIHKDFDEGPFPFLWDKAKKCLSKCKQLIIIGYSFPTSDFVTKKLLLEAFKNNSLESLIVVDPDKSVIKKVADMTHFKGTVRWHKGLKGFLEKN